MSVENSLLNVADQRYFNRSERLHGTNNVRATGMVSDVTSKPTGNPLVLANDMYFWDDFFEETQEKWEGRVNMRIILQSILTLTNMFRTNVSLAGWTLGYICYRIRQFKIREASQMNMSVEHQAMYADSFLKGLILTGTCRNYEVSSNDDGSIRIELFQTEIKEFPLEKVSFFNPERKKRVNRVTGREYNDRTLTDIVNSEHFGSYLYQVVSKQGGSDISVYQLWDNCYIARKTNPPIPDYMFRRLGVTRTGGFGNILLKDYTITFTVDGEEFRVYIPSGKENCFNSCIQWGYMEQAYTFSELNLEAELEMDSKTRLKHEIENILLCIKKRRNNFNNADIKKYEKKYQKGYTSRELKNISKELLKENIEVTCVDIRSKEQIFNVCEPAKSEEEIRIRLFLFRMCDNGEVLKNISKNQVSDESSGLLHAISIHPFPTKFMNSNVSYRRSFLEALESKTKRVMEEIYTITKYEENVSNDDLQEYVKYQNGRYESNITRTLIFKHDLEEKDNSFKSGKRKQAEREYANKVDTYVFAYDLETVTNKSENQYMVYEPFELISEDATHDPIHTQIPFSAQWVPVNVSDSGRYYDRKCMEGIVPRQEEVCTTCESIEEGCIYSRIDDVLLDKVVTEYGDYMLGKCVEDMLLHIAQWIDRRGGKTGFLYAHNGVGFDAYIVLKYNRFKVKKILKTPRGILSMSIRVKLDESKKIVLHLRDTKVHVPGSLSSLCKCFGVPKIWTKIDFPIARITAKSCYEPEVLSISKAYGENDVKCLAFIVKRINESLMDNEWDPAILSNKPPITQFLTLMSMVKKATLNHFIKTIGYQNIKTRAVDLPILRNWISNATFGGRVNTYARTFSHKYMPGILKAYEAGDVEALKFFHERMILEKSGYQVLDVTSLYPTAQALCPMPTGELYHLSIEQCERSIKIIGCKECKKNFSLCVIHNYSNPDIYEERPFVIILVRNCVPCKENIRCMVPRKLQGSKRSEGLEYSLETVDQLNARYGKKVMYEVQSYTNIDLYWMKKQGYRYEIIGGFGWKTSMIYNSFIQPAFMKRIEAKRAGNKVLSNTLKLMYNSTYGVTVQKDITDSGFIMQLPEECNGLHHSDYRVLKQMNAKHTHLDCDEYLDDSILLPSGQTYFLKKKKENIAEYFDAQSPNQIGCAVLAWARHIMNLIMFNCDVRTQTYTDTDSISMDDYVIQERLMKVPGLIDNSTDAYMGTLKNDHLEGPNGESNGKEPRVFLTLIGTKKVKMHVTLNENGEIKIFNTFKGLNPSCIHPDTGKRMDMDYVNKMVSDSIIAIHEKGYMPDVMVSQWKKSMNTGVIIEDHIQTSSKNTYLGHCKGSYLMGWKSVTGVSEMFLPHGILVNSFSDLEKETPSTFLHVKNKEGDYYLTHVIDKEQKDATDLRLQTLKKYGFKHKQIYKFVEKYYGKWKQEETNSSEEYKKIVDILEKY